MILLSIMLSLASSLQGRIAITHDGDLHDPDDIGAVAMMEALLWRAGAQPRLVHLSFGNHIGSTSASMHAAMAVSATAALGMYGIAPDQVWDADERRATLQLAREIGLSSVDNPLVIIQAGPWAWMAKAFDLASPATHRYVTIVSHSTWNDSHDHPGWGLNRAQFLAQYAAGGKWAGVVAPGYVKISDQNAHAFNSSQAAWSWLALSPETSFVLQRTIASGKPGDMSDAGMLWWVLTGDTNPSMSEVRAFFGL